MKIKKFKARNFTEALEMVKKELGRDAIILSSEEKKGLRPYVEVTSAVDYDNSYHDSGRAGMNKTQVVRQGRPAAGDIGFSAYDSRSDIEGPPADTTKIDAIRNEIGSLRETIESMKNNGYEMSLPGRKRMILNYLRERAVREEFALRLCDKANDINDIISLISDDIRVKGPVMDKKAVMLVGPTGVGKTTTIAKLSAQAVKQGKRAAIINLDTYRIGAVEQIRIYARIMGIPVSNAANSEELRESLVKYARNRDIIFIDTTGRNPMDEKYISDMVEVCRNAWAGGNEDSFLPVELHLLLSASSDDAFMIESYKSYSRLPVNCLAFTKVDEAVRFGSLYNSLLTYQRPLAYITTGQKVPSDIQYVTEKKLAGLILNKGNYKC
jgi:flagellar biosynthesis protein FlhF